MVNTSCRVSGCTSTSRGNKQLRFHQFPHNEKRCLTWLKACNRPDADELVRDNKCKHMYICSLHFEKRMYRLSKKAVPTLHLSNGPIISEKVEADTDDGEKKPFWGIDKTPNDKEDEYDMFCKSLAYQLKRMPLDRALICQQKLQEVMTAERLAQCEQSEPATPASDSDTNSDSNIVVEYFKVESEDVQ